MGELLDEVRQLWAALAGTATATFSDGPLHVAVAANSRTAPQGWCGAVHVEGQTLITAPDEWTARRLEEVLAGTGVDTAERLLPAVVSRALPGVVEVLGPASLSYRAPGASGTATATASSSSWAVEAVDDDGPGGWRDQLADACSPDDVAESDLEALSHAHVVRDGRGVVVAAAGWVLWDGGVAHVGVLAAPAVRGRGAAAAVASAAVEAAAEAGRLVQWRAGPEPSRRLAHRLGLVAVGWQLSWRWTG